MKVLMIGWEFPPFFAGGVGIVCYELSKALSQDNVKISYIMPFGPRDPDPQFLEKMLIAENLKEKITVHTVPTTMHAYMTEEEYQATYTSTMLEAKGTGERKNMYGGNLYEEVHKFAHRAARIALEEDFDIIHCHDWMTIPAAIWIKQLTGKPLVVHIHNTVYDRYLSGFNNLEKDIEQKGLDEADKVIALSWFVKNRLVNSYNVDPNKIDVIYWGAQTLEPSLNPPKISSQDKVVLYAGRVTAQKGPEYFVHAARKVLDHEKDVKFIMAGSGDMLHQMIDLVADLGMANHFLFPGFYSRKQVVDLFSMADVFVMPSVSEPFGIVPFEAMSVGTPTIISKQSGISEVLTHALKVDFWDTHALAAKILSVLKYEALHHTLKNHGIIEVQGQTWDKTASEVKNVYKSLIHEVTQ